MNQRNPRTTGGPATTAHQRPQSTSPAAVLAAFATVLLGGPNAIFDRVMVKACPLYCGAVHVHYVSVGLWRKPLVRAPRCAPSRRYRLDVVDVLPAVPALVGQRKRGVA